MALERRCCCWFWFDPAAIAPLMAMGPREEGLADSAAAEAAEEEDDEATTMPAPAICRGGAGLVGATKTEVMPRV